MNIHEKTIARTLFQNKIYKADGQAFEDLFVHIMNYLNNEFQLIKPWGNIGDRKNDGYIESEGIYYQVYAPEDIRKSYPKLIKKLKEDFLGLIEQWPKVKEYYFVVNDKYKGVNADAEQSITSLKEKFNLNKSRILVAKDIENMLFSLEDDQILSITGFLPDPINLKHIDYDVLNEVIVYIMDQSSTFNNEYDIILPDLEEKIQFNGLSKLVAMRLKNGLINVIYLEEYLANNSDFLSDTLRDQLNGIYLEMKEDYTGDELFINIMNRLSPKNEFKYQSTVMILMSKYFESCDIFEEPVEEVTQ